MIVMMMTSLMRRSLPLSLPPSLSNTRWPLHRYCGGRTLELRPLGELLEDAQAMLRPSQGIGLHGRAVLINHACEALELLLHVSHRLVSPLLDELLLLVGAPLLSLVDVTEGGAPLLLDVLLHVLVLGAELVAHGHVCLLGVHLPTIARLLVEVPDGGPATCSGALVRAVDGAHLVLGERHVSKDDIKIALKGLNDLVPAGRLLDSSASALRGDPPHKDRLALVHVLLHKVVRRVGGQLRGALPVALRVDACLRDAGHRQHTHEEAQGRHGRRKNPGTGTALSKT